jgi:hypothetical protein
MVCAMNLPAGSVAEVARPEGSRERLWRAVMLMLAGLSLFLIGRHFSYRSTDFIVYHEAAKSFLAGRTDLYSATFAWGPPMQYVYPPLFLLLVFPLGWLSFTAAFGIWFAGLALATGLLILLAYREWRPRRVGEYGLILVTLAAVPVLYALRTGNAHLGVVLLTLAGFVAWSKERTWTASICLALAGVVKVFPLFLLPFLLVRREWKLALRFVSLSCVLWAVPMAYFGPRQTVSLYRSWYSSVPADVQRFEGLHQLDYSFTGAIRRWLTHVDYSQHRDKDHPEVNWLDLSAATVRVIARILNGFVLGLSLLMASMLPKPGAEAPTSKEARHRLVVATTASLFVTSQLLFGPYTIFLYLCGWLAVALTLPVVFQHGAERLNHWLLGIGLANLVILAIPGRSNHRALEAYGVFTLLNIALWLISLMGGWKLLRPTKFPEAID